MLMSQRQKLRCKQLTTFLTDLLTIKSMLLADLSLTMHITQLLLLFEKKQQNILKSRDILTKELKVRMEVPLLQLQMLLTVLVTSATF